MMMIIFKHSVIDLFFFFNFPVFRYLADKYLQKLKQQTAEDSEVVHTSSNKIGMYTIIEKPLETVFCAIKAYGLICFLMELIQGESESIITSLSKDIISFCKITL